MSASVFPARAGMSPVGKDGEGNPESVPRASGDEPEIGHSHDAAYPCSPRERG